MQHLPLGTATNRRSLHRQHRFSANLHTPLVTWSGRSRLRIEVRQKRQKQPLTEQRRAQFLAALAELGNLGAAAREASPGAMGDASATFRQARRKDPEGFGAAVEDALEAYNDKIRAEAHRRGVVGIPVDVIGPTGTVIGTRIVKSDRVLMKLMDGRLKEHNPTKRIESVVEQTVRHAPAPSMGLDQLTPAEQDKLREVLESALARRALGEGNNATTAATPPVLPDEDDS